MQIKGKFMAAVFAVVALATGALADNCYWLTDAEGGIGGWASEGRWKNKAVPQTGDVAYVHGLATVATVDDLAVFDRLARVYTESESDVFCFAVSGEHEITTGLDGHGKSRFDTGSAVRLTVVSGNSVHYYMRAGMEVLSGTMYLPKDTGTSGLYIGPLMIASGATVVVGESGHVRCGLAGAGSVTSPTDGGANIRLCFGSEDEPMVFSGLITGKVQLELCGGYQQLTNPANENSGDFRFRYGALGLSSLGADGGVGSFGKSIVWAQNGDTEARLCYLGTGEVSTRTFNFGSNPANEIVFDGGPHGGLELAGAISGGNGVQRCLVLDGDGTEAVNQLSGSFDDPSDGGTTHIVKRGRGTWRLPAKAAQYHGVFAVEEGTLEFGSMAAAGTASSLGFANRLYERESGRIADLTPVSWAYLLGNGYASEDSDSLATFSYVGIDDVDCSTRPIAVLGAARLRNASEADFRYAGVTTAWSGGDHTLVLDGEGMNNALVSIDEEGSSTLKVVKEGPGQWTLGGVGGSVALSGGVRVKHGRLCLKNAERYSWYRFRVIGTYEAGTTCRIGHIGFYDAAGNEILSGYQYYTDGAWWNRGARPDLIPPPGSYCFESSAYIAGSADPKKVFGAYTQDGYSDFTSQGKVISPEAPVAFIIRLAADAASPVAYDIVTGWYATGKPYQRTMVSWTVEGSENGLDWVELDRRSNHSAIYNKNGNYWLSDGKLVKDTLDHASVTGFGVSTSYTLADMPTNLNFLEVADGGTFEVATPITISGLGIDGSSTQSGAYRGVRFGSNGVINVRNLPLTGLSYRLDCDDDADFENLQNWEAVDSEGRSLGLKLSTDDHTLSISRAGMVIYIY